MKIKVIVKIAADTWQVIRNVDAVFLQMLSRSNARKEKQLWTIERASAQNDFIRGVGCFQSTRLEIFDPDRSVIFYKHPDRGRVC